MPLEYLLNFAVHTSLITLTFSRGWCDFQLICNYEAPWGGEGGWLNNRPRPEVTERHCSWPYGLRAEGQRVGGRRGVGTGKLPEWSDAGD